MITFPKALTSLAVAGSMIAGQAVALSSDAAAREFRGRGDGHRYHAPAPRRYEPRYYGHGHRRDRKGDAVAATILGLGAVIIGAAIADAHKNRRDRYDD